MKRPRKSTFGQAGAITFILALGVIFSIALPQHPSAYAEYHDIVLSESFAGNVNFQMTGGSLRSQPNSANPCSLSATSTGRLTSMPSPLTPPDGRIIAAHLYWAGSGSPDEVVRFENLDTGANNVITSTRTLREDESAWDFFLGFADVTGMVTPNAQYRFSGLTVNSSPHYCDSQTVLAGWSLIVFYEHSGEPLRVINLYSGFRHFQHSSITLTPGNFRVPTNGCNGLDDCKWGVLTWEGDPTLPNFWNPTPEVLRVNGASITNPPVNPSGNQFNSTIDIMNTTPNPPGTAMHGVDVDVYSLQGLLSAAGSATTYYASGQDLVLLSAEIFSVVNEPVADLAISKSHSGNFSVGQQGIYTLSVTNNGPVSHTGQVTVTDTLPPGLTYVSASGSNWSCGNTGQVVSCTTTQGPIADGARFSDITLTVDVDAAAAPSVTNTAEVEGALFDNVSSNDTHDDPTTVINVGPSAGTKQLYFYMDNAPAADRNTIQRVVNSQNSRANIDAGDAAIFLLSPALQAPLTLENNPINVDIWLRRIQDGSGQRDVTVTLDDNGSPASIIGTDTISWNVDDMQLIRFSFTPTPDTLAPGTTLRLTLTNEASSSGRIRARSFRNGTRSQIALGTTTVINVDSVAAYSDVAYPGGVPLSSVGPNTPIRIRAVVTDPFGHDDINSATLTLVDANNNTQISNGTLSAIATPPSTPPSLNSTKIFEYNGYTVPSTGPHGTWTAIVTANEGTEGTISHTDRGTFTVAMPNIVMTKTISTISNPAEGTVNAHAIPGAIMQYEIVVTNTGSDPVSNIIINDPLPENLRLVLNSSIEPVTFIDGPSASGLSFNPADVGNSTGPFDDVAVSNWSGSGMRTFLPRSGISVDTEGVDNLPTRINFIRINPKGTFAGSTGGPDPSFTLQFRLKLD